MTGILPQFAARVHRDLPVPSFCSFLKPAAAAIPGTPSIRITPLSSW